MSGKHKAVQSIPRCVVNFLKKPRILVGSNTGCWIPHATTDNVEGSLQLELRNNGLTSSAARLKWYESMVSRGSATQNNHENHNNQSSRSQHKLHEDERMKRWSRTVLSSCCGSAEHCIPARLTSMHVSFRPDAWPTSQLTPSTNTLTHQIAANTRPAHCQQTSSRPISAQVHVTHLSISKALRAHQATQPRKLRIYQHQNYFNVANLKYLACVCALSTFIKRIG